MRVCCSVTAVAVFTVLLAGCDRPPALTYPVSGRVTFEEEPVKGANVTFVPERDRPAFATTDDDGRFELSTFKAGDGAVAGRHTVTIILHNPADAMVIAGRMSDSPIPYRYTVPQQTPFKVEVVPDEENHFELNMTKEEQ